MYRNLGYKKASTVDPFDFFRRDILALGKFKKVYFSVDNLQSSASGHNCAKSPVCSQPSSSIASDVSSGTL
jgi:hypothetical protein